MTRRGHIGGVALAVSILGVCLVACSAEEPAPPPDKPTTRSAHGMQRAPAPAPLKVRGFPSSTSTGLTVDPSDLTPSGPFDTRSNGQIVENLEIRGGLDVTNSDVVVRNVRVTQTGEQYAIRVERGPDGRCPTGVVIENVEVLGDTADLKPGTKAVYFRCPATFRNSYVHDVSSGVRLTDGSVVQGNYVVANYAAVGDDSHRSAVGLNGGSGNVIRGNTLLCLGPGCSAALAMYGDFSRVSNILIQQNLLGTTGSYCTYAGSINSKPFPVSQDVRYIGNRFSETYNKLCGKYGPVAGTNDGDSPGFVWRDNVWLSSGQEVPIGRK